MAAKGARFAFAASSASVAADPGITRQVLCHDEGIMMVRFVFTAGAAGPLHSHPHKQCSLVETGVFDVTIDGETARLSAGDGYLVAPHAMHAAHCVDAGVIVDVFTPMRDDFV